MSRFKGLDLDQECRVNGRKMNAQETGWKSPHYSRGNQTLKLHMDDGTFQGTWIVWVKNL